MICFKGFLGTEAWNLLLSGLFPGPLVYSISESKFGRSRLLMQGFHMEVIAKTIFSWTSFLMDFTIDFHCFLEALGTVFLVFATLERG